MQSKVRHKNQAIANRINACFIEMRYLHLFDNQPLNLNPCLIFKLTF